MTGEIRILLADDHPIYREGLRKILGNEPSFEVVAEAGNGEEALRRIRELQPQVALLDVNMPGLDGLDVARACRGERLACALIFLTMHRDETLLQEAIATGVRGYVLKESVADEIIQAVRTVAGGGDYLSPSMAGLLMQRSRRSQALAETQQGIGSLAASEKRVLRLIASDRTSKEIAEELGLSVRTVENHRARICTKLGLHGAHSLVKFAFEHKAEL